MMKIPILLILLILCLAGTSQAQGSSVINCDEIAVMGAVHAPGRFNKQKRIRLIEVLAIAGGPTARAGKVVNVHHSCKCSPCTELEARTQEGSEYSLPAVLAGKETANVAVEPGDIVIVPELNIVLVMGNVPVQKSLTFREEMTLTQAIALAGGLQRSGDGVQIKIRRRLTSGPWSVVFVGNLKAILEGKAENPRLSPMDLLEVSDEQGRFFYDAPLKPAPKGDPPSRRTNSPDC